MANFHVSDMSNFLKCEWAWDYSSHLRYGKGVEDTNGPMWKGTAVHQLIEFAHNHRQPPSDAHPENIAIANNYMNWQKKQNIFQGVIATEHAVSVPFFIDESTGEQHTFNSRFDVVAWYENKIWIADYKVTGQDFGTYEEHLYLQGQQFRAYSWMATQLYGENFGGIMPIFIKNKPPEEPRYIANGTKLSRAKTQNTTWSKYKKAIKQIGDDPLDYEEMRLALTANEFVRATPITFTQKALNRWYDRAVIIAKRMIDPNYKLIPAENVVTCRGCHYRHPCHIRMDISEEQALDYVIDNYNTTGYVQRARDEVINNINLIDPETGELI